MSTAIAGRSGSSRSASPSSYARLVRPREASKATRSAVKKACNGPSTPARVAARRRSASSVRPSVQNRLPTRPPVTMGRTGAASGSSARPARIFVGLFAPAEP